MTSNNMKQPLRLAAAVALAVSGAAHAHHPISGKFDSNQAIELEGVVTAVDWRNPHAHVFLNVTGDDGEVVNWAIELESPVVLERSGWERESVRPGDRVSVNGIRARNGTRQVWADALVFADTGREVLVAHDLPPKAPRTARPTPRWPDGTPMLGAPGTEGGYWAYPTRTALVEDGVRVEMNADGLLANLEDAAKVAPMQPWALGLYMHRQRRFLQDDPMYLNCKPPGGVRHLQSSLGVQFVEDRERQRIFVLMGGGNHNYRIIYLDGREQKGQVGGDDDNPLYYGRSVGHWEGDTLVVDTAGFNEDFWFTNGGLPHTDQLRLIERFSRPDLDTLLYEVEVQDPGAYTRNWKSSWELRWVGGEELPSYFCQDNRS
ncbi:MAG TPA: DUF6152 family protein [Gammaproteobacteria bacterium]